MHDSEVHPYTLWEFLCLLDPPTTPGPTLINPSPTHLSSFLPWSLCIPP